MLLHIALMLSFLHATAFEQSQEAPCQCEMRDTLGLLMTIVAGCTKDIELPEMEIPKMKYVSIMPDQEDASVKTICSGCYCLVANNKLLNWILRRNEFGDILVYLTIEREFFENNEITAVEPQLAYEKDGCVYFIRQTYHRSEDLEVIFYTTKTSGAAQDESIIENTGIGFCIRGDYMQLFNRAIDNYRNNKNIGNLMRLFNINPPQSYRKNKSNYNFTDIDNAIQEIVENANIVPIECRSRKRVSKAARISNSIKEDAMEKSLDLGFNPEMSSTPMARILIKPRFKGTPIMPGSLGMVDADDASPHPGILKQQCLAILPSRKKRYFVSFDTQPEVFYAQSSEKSTQETLEFFNSTNFDPDVFQAAHDVEQSSMFDPMVSGPEAFYGSLEQVPVDIFHSLSGGTFAPEIFDASEEYGSASSNKSPLPAATSTAPWPASAPKLAPIEGFQASPPVAPPPPFDLNTEVDNAQQSLDKPSADSHENLSPGNTASVSAANETTAHLDASQNNGSAIQNSSAAVGKQHSSIDDNSSLPTGAPENAPKHGCSTAFSGATKPGEAKKRSWKRKLLYAFLFLISLSIMGAAVYVGMNYYKVYRLRQMARRFDIDG